MMRAMDISTILKIKYTLEPTYAGDINITCQWSTANPVTKYT